jgi:hypothetical protein
MRARPPRIYDVEMAWWKFLLCAFLLILFIVGEWLLTVVLMTISLPFVAWGHLKAYYRETFRGS